MFNHRIKIQQAAEKEARRQAGIDKRRGKRKPRDFDQCAIQRLKEGRFWQGSFIKKDPLGIRLQKSFDSASDKLEWYLWYKDKWCQAKTATIFGEKELFSYELQQQKQKGKDEYKSKK